MVADGKGSRRLKSALGATAVATKSTEVDWARDRPGARPSRHRALVPSRLQRPWSPAGSGGSWPQAPSPDFSPGITRAEATTAARDRPLAAPLLTIAAVTLGYTLQLSDGHFVPEALAWLALALAACVAAVVAPALRPRLRQEPILLGLLGAGLAFQFFQLARTPPGQYLVAAWPGDYLPFFLGVAVAAGLAGIGIWGVGPLQRAWFPLLLVTHFLVGVWVIGMSPQPRIDVF